MITHKISTELTTQQLVQLSILVGKLNNMTILYQKTQDILDTLRIPSKDTIKISYRYVDIKDHNDFQNACKNLVSEALTPRKTIELNGKVYYVDELERVLANLNEVEKK